MEKIKSFTVNHLILEPGIYESRQDKVGDEILYSYDLRMTAPNQEPVLNTGEIHTIEHLAATYLRNHKDYKNRIIYFGPMGCRTGFYLVVNGKFDNKIFHQLILDTFEFCANFEGEIPGATARDCGNYLDHNLPMAKYVSARYVKTLKSMTDFSFEYLD